MSDRSIGTPPGETFNMSAIDLPSGLWQEGDMLTLVLYAHISEPDENDTCRLTFDGQVFRGFPERSELR